MTQVRRSKRDNYMRVAEGVHIKRCYACQCWYPATTDHFREIRKGEVKLRGDCRTCDNASSRVRKQRRKQRGQHE